MKAMLLFLFSALALAQFVPTIPATKTSGGGTAPTVVQVIPAVTNGGTAGSACNTFSSATQSITCTMASLGAAHYLVYSVLTSSTLTAINAPTTSGAGCSGVTWTAIGTATANAAAWSSSVTSSGACTVTGTSTSSAGATLQATVREMTSTTGTIDSGPKIGTSVTSCTSCSAPSASVALVTSVNNDLAICDSIASGSPGTMTMSGTFTQDINTSGGLPWIGGHLVQATAGTVAKMTWSATSSSWHTNCFAMEP